MNRAFTLIEVLIVIIVISIISAISITAYSVYQDNAADGQKKALVSTIRAGAERYFSTNNEYPLASQLSTVSAARSVLDTSAELLDGSKAKLLACSGACSITNTARVYYVTKPDQANTAAQVTTIGSCSYTLPASDTGAVSYLIFAYIKPADSDYRRWAAVRSVNGKPTVSGGCSFATTL